MGVAMTNDIDWAAFEIRLSLPPAAERVEAARQKGDIADIAGRLPLVGVGILPNKHGHDVRVDRVLAWCSERPTRGEPDRAVFYAVVIGRSLQAATSGWCSPGAGNWTVLKIVEPDEAFLAFDLTEGVGQIVPSRLPADRIAKVLIDALQ
jgi:hypothetical protein